MSFLFRQIVEGIEPGEQPEALHTEQFPGPQQSKAVYAYEEQTQGEDERLIGG